MTISSPPRRPGFTLVEMLVSLTIVLLLTAIVYVALAPVRAKASETRCISNLRQIGAAIQMYRQDYGGQDPPEALTKTKGYGLPPSITDLKPYLTSFDLLKCQSAYFSEGVAHPLVSYQVVPIEGENPRHPNMPRFSQIVAKYGEETPLLLDPHHGNRFRPVTPKPRVAPVLVLNLNGQVRRRVVPVDASCWEW